MSSEAISRSLELTGLEYRFSTPPYTHQLAALRAAAGRPAFAYLMEMRTGKTKVVLDEAAALARAGRLRALVVVAPKGVHAGWLRELAAHGPRDVETRAHAWRGGTTRREAFELDNLVRWASPAPAIVGSSRPRLAVFTLNWDALLSARARERTRVFLTALAPTMLVADEAHRMKSPSAQRTRAMFKLAPLAAYRRVLTGTIVANDPLDVWGPFTFLDPAILRVRSYYAFRALYAVLQRRVVHGVAFDEVVGYRHLDELQRRLAPHSFAVAAADCLDLPPRSYVTVPVALSSEQARLYDGLATELEVELDGARMTAPLALTRLLRLQQLLGGFFAPDVLGDSRPGAPPEHPLLPLRSNPRVAALVEYLRDVPGAAVVWTRFVAERHAVAAVLADLGPVGVVGAGGPDAEAAIESFRGGATRFLVANPDGPAGEGRDLSVASHLVYFSNSFKLTTRLQSEARGDRRGRAGGVTVVDLVAPDTVDEAIVAALRAKRDVAALFAGPALRAALRGVVPNLQEERTDDHQAPGPPDGGRAPERGGGASPPEDGLVARRPRARVSPRGRARAR